MKQDEQALKIPTVSKETNFWMIRAKRGFFFDEFLRKEYIAIGWNLINRSMICNPLDAQQENALKASIKATYGDSRPGTALNKCIRFCNELRVGDIAVIVDSNRMAFAYVGEYYEENSPKLTVDFEKDIHSEIEKTNPEHDHFECPYTKRRKISIIKVLDRGDTISPYLQNAIAKNWHSLSNLNEYAELILSGCFDTVIFEDKLMVTFRVRRQTEINVLDMSDFVLNAAKLLSNNRPETVHVKTTLHSPGDIILQIWNAVQDNALPLLICYIAVFGGKAGNYEFNSLIGVIKSLINSRYEKEKQKLELRKLSAEADLVEQQAISAELDNIERIKTIQQEAVNSCVQPLADAAKNLEVEPCQATIIDLTSVIKKEQE